MKKKLNSCLLLGAMLFCLSTLLTSCEELFGEWNKPAPVVIPPSSVVDEAKVLGAALEAGATVSVTYKIGSTTYVATFIKNSDDSYTLQSNAKVSSARALTRSAADPAVTEGDGATVGDQVQLLLSGNKLKLVVKASNGAPLFEATMNIETGEIAIINTNAKGVNCAIGSFAVNGDTKDIKNPEMQNVTINFTYDLTIPGLSSALSLTFNYAVQYLNGETWADVIARYKECDHGEIGSTSDDFISITFRKDIATEVIKAAVSTLDYTIAVLVTPEKIEELATAVSQTKLYLYTQAPLTARALTRTAATQNVPVRSADVVDGSKTYVLSVAAPVTYKKGAWDNTEKKVVFTNEAAVGPTVVQSSDADVTWSDGWYTVSGDVTINGNVNLGADTHLILQDGAKLTINGYIFCYIGADVYNLYIYGQAEGTGKLNVTGDGYTAINGAYHKTIEIHGGEITAECNTVSNCNGLYCGYFNIFGGKLTAISTASGASAIYFCDDFCVYGGEVIAEANSTNTDWYIYGIDSPEDNSESSYCLTVYSGKVQAAGNGKDYGHYGQAIHANIQSGTSGIKFYFSDDNTTWDAGTYYSTATTAPNDKRYAKVE